MQKTKKLMFFFVVITCIYCCNKEQEPIEQSEKQHQIEGIVCKYQNNDTDNPFHDSLSCIEYHYDEMKQELFVKHINTAFACGGQMFYSVNIIDNRIEINEIQGNGIVSSCLCLYDFDIYIKNINKTQWKMIVVEPYLKNQKELNFTFDLTSSNTGVFCVKRIKYPWNED